VWDELRGQGLGAAEREAARSGCHQVMLQTHSFQAPRFYERRGYRLLAVIPNYPPGHDKRLYLKAL
jgi:GNAT superfamily N-acetyltransferase